MALSTRTMKLGQLDVCKSSESDYSHRFRVSTSLPKQFVGPEKPGVAMVSYVVPRNVIPTRRRTSPGCIGCVKGQDEAGANENCFKSMMVFLP
jgi:hypothetical protein